MHQYKKALAIALVAFGMLLVSNGLTIQELRAQIAQQRIQERYGVTNASESTTTMEDSASESNTTTTTTKTEQPAEENSATNSTEATTTSASTTTTESTTSAASSTGTTSMEDALKAQYRAQKEKHMTGSSDWGFAMPDEMWSNRGAPFVMKRYK
uniref:Uncharacterized protein n=1 Tax=Anopheles culicifacies TaxID=139723 RepID=A0A182MRZ7_9DIPT